MLEHENIETQSKTERGNEFNTGLNLTEGELNKHTADWEEPFPSSRVE